MSEVSKVHTGPSIQSNVTYVGGIKSGVCSCIQSNATHIRGVERDSKYIISAYDIFAYKKSFGKLRLRAFQAYHQMICMSKHVRGVRCIACVKYYTMNKGSNAMYIKSVESSSIYTIRAVMLCMSKVLKEVQSALTHLCS